MIGSIETVAAAMVGDIGPSLALIPQQQDSPFGDILGYVIVFFVVIWPIIRGLLGNASEQRKKHEQQQRRAGGRPKPRDVPGRGRLDAFIEEMVSGQRARGDMGDAEAQVPVGTQRAVGPAAAVVEGPPPIPRRAKSRAPSTRPAPQAGLERGTSPLSDARIGDTRLGGAAMGRELVPESVLSHLESENEAEAIEDHTQPIERLALSESKAAMTVTSDVHEAALVRIHRGRTPWQAAFVLKEVLGPPGGLRSSIGPYC